MTQDEGYGQLLRLSQGEVDSRSDQGKRHQLSEVLFVLVVALLCGAQNAEDVALVGRSHKAWFLRMLTLKHGIPSHDTFLAVMSLVKAEAIETLVRAWTSALRAPGALSVEGGHIAVDGQALRGSIDRAAGTSAVHMISAYLTGLGVTLGSLRVDDKSNEITAIPDLIRSLNVRGATVTIDAMGCQRAIASVLREEGAHYVLQVKENQPNLLSDAKETMAELVRRRRPGEAPAQYQRHREVDKGHGRLETRVCVLSHDLSGIERRADWKDLAGIVALMREREDLISGKKSQETSYFIVSNASASAADLAEIIRNHWVIENGLHWSLDVVWGSDAHKVRDRTAAENLARLRRFCAGMIKLSTGWGMSGRRVRMSCGLNPDNVLSVLAGEVIDRPRGRRPNRSKVGRYGEGVKPTKPAK